MLCFLGAHGTSPFAPAAQTAGVHVPGIQSLWSEAISPPLLDLHSSVTWTQDPPLLHRMDTARVARYNQSENVDIADARLGLDHSPQREIRRPRRPDPTSGGGRNAFCVSRPQSGSPRGTPTEEKQATMASLVREGDFFFLTHGLDFYPSHADLCLMR